jgi:hypothetical protein
MIDDRKLIKDYINNICLWVLDEYKNKSNTLFKIWPNQREYRLSFILKDKGIEKRIGKKLIRMGLNPLVKYHKDEDYPLGIISIILK